MAKMFPPEPWAATTSRAEQKLFNVIKSHLGDDWIVLHSLGLANHSRKQWAEIDFVLIGAPGIYCLEVKGGRVTRYDGLWHFTNRNDETSTKHEGPFEQVKSAAYALRDFLNKRLPGEIRDTVVGWGVLFPDILFAVDGPDIEPRLVYDTRDVENRFSAYVRRLVDYWHEKIEDGRAKPVEMISPPRIQRIFEVLRGDFDLRPSLRTRIGNATGELIRLTGEQYTVMDGLSSNARILIRGGAGTGKTLLAVEESRRLADRGARVFLCCYNRQLALYLRPMLQDRPLVEVHNLHSFMKAIVCDAGLEGLLPAASEVDLFAVFYPELALQALLESNLLEKFDALIIDEGQDLLLDTYVDLFDRLLRGGIRQGTWRIFLDHNQDVFSGTSPEALRTVLAAGPAEYGLNINCRNTRPIATVTQMISGVGSGNTLGVDGPEIEEVWYRDERHQQREIGKCVNRLLSEGIRPSDIVILSRYRLDNGALRFGLPNSTLSVKPYGVGELVGNSSAIRYATTRSFKGLESDVVLVIDINDITSSEALYEFYVGSSRARAYLALFIDESQRENYAVHAGEYGRWLKEHYDGRA